MRAVPLATMISRLGLATANASWKRAGTRCLTESAGKTPKFSMQTVMGNQNSASRCGSEPAMVRNLEKKTLDELKDLHIDTVDEDEDEAIVVGGKHTFSWKVSTNTLFLTKFGPSSRSPTFHCLSGMRAVDGPDRSACPHHLFCPIGVHAQHFR
jgi:hypothetical protein